MTNAYFNLILKGEKPKKYLADGRRFLADSIERENRELEAAKLGETDIDHTPKMSRIGFIPVLICNNHS